MRSEPGKPQCGDFGLVAIPGDVGALIRFGQYLNGDGWGTIQHAFQVLSNSEAIEAEPGGAKIVPLSKYANVPVTWSSWDLSGAARHSLDVHGRELEGVPYSFLDYDAIACHRLHIPVPGLRAYIADTGHMICSQMVDEIHARGGLKMFDDGRWPGYVTPMSLRRVLTGPLAA